MNETEPVEPLHGKRVAFVGKLGGLTKRQAQQLVRDQGGQPIDRVDHEADLVIVGAEELPLEEDALLDESIRQAAAEGKLEIITETQLWQRLGLFEEPDVQLYTPAMLAELLHVPVSVIRRWHRRKLIVPVREVHRLPYFDFQEVATARQLAQLLAAGASPDAIERKLAELSRYVPEVERPLAQLSVIVEGKLLLLRQGEGLIEPGGQLRIDFASLDGQESTGDGNTHDTLPLAPEPSLPTTPEEMLRLASQLEDHGQLQAAADLKRAVMAAAGPRAEVCFELAELLYRLGDLRGSRNDITWPSNWTKITSRRGPTWGACWPRRAISSWLSPHFRVRWRTMTTTRTCTTTWLARSTNWDVTTKENSTGKSSWRLAPNSPWSDEAYHRLYGSR